MDDLALLLRQLDRADSPHARLELIARAWKSVRRLAPNERARLAQAVGIEGAESIIEGLAAREGRLRPGVLMRALELAHDKDPAELGHLLRGLRSRKGRRDLVRKGATAMAEYLRGDVVPTPPVVEQPPAAKTAKAKAVAKAAAAAAGATATVAAAKAVASRPSEPARPRVDPPKAPPKPPVTQVSPPAPAAAKPPVRVVPPPVPVVPVPKRVDAREAPTLVKPPAPAPRVDVGALLARLESAPGATHRLRRLRAGLEPLRHAPPEAIAEVLDRFEAWARRRALSVLLEAGLPGDADQALELIRGEASTATRRWCRSTLLHRDGLPATARERVRAYDPAAT